MLGRQSTFRSWFAMLQLGVEQCGARSARFWFYATLQP
jgi:hypothetical protein